MNLLESLNQSLAYIEEHLTEEIDVKEAARHAACSEYHFKRMFSFLAGLSLSEYIRRRRLTLAAFDLQNTKLRIIDAAVKYGYQSPDAFTKAFHSFHGVTPSEARNNDQSLKVYPRLYFQLTIRGGNEMIYRIVEKEAFRIVGIMKRVPIQFHGVNPEIAAMWRSLDESTIALMKSLSNGTPSGIISASTNFSDDRMEEKGELDHYIGVATTLENPAPFVKLEVPAMTWAVFEVAGPFPAALQEIWGRVYSEWFPASPYEQVEGPEMLWNESKEVSSPAFRSEIWIPVKRKPNL